MYVLNNIALALLLALFWILSYFIIEGILRSKKVVNYHFKTYFINIFSGSAFGAMFVIFEIILKYIYNATAVPFYIVCVLLLALYKPSLVTVISFFPGLIYELVVEEINYLALLLVISTFLTLITWEVTKIFKVPNIIDKLIYFVAIGFFFSINLGINYALESLDDVNSLQIQKTVLTSLVFVVASSIVIYTMRFSISANILFESINFVFSKYYRHSFAEQAIKTYIAKTNINYGFYVIFVMDYKRQLEHSHNQEIQESVLLDIEKAVGSKGVCFGINENTWGFFYGMEHFHNIGLSIEGNSKQNRDNNDLVGNIESIIKDASKKYITTFGKEVIVQVKSALSVYGLQDNSYSKLEQQSFFALNTRLPKDNVVKVFNPVEYFERLKDHQKVQLIDSFLKLDNYSLSYNWFYNLKNNNFEFLSQEIIDWSNIARKDSLTKTLYALEWLNEFEKYFAVQFMNSISDHSLKVAFSYHPIVIDKDFNISNFKNKILSFGFDLKNINFILDGQILNQGEFNFVYLNEIKKLGIKIFITNPEGLDFSYIKKIDPALMIFNDLPNQNILKKFKSNYLIAWNGVNNLTQLDLASKLGINLISGKILNLSKDVYEIDKESKIYIRELVNKSVVEAKNG